jgi:hypothetical protein
MTTPKNFLLRCKKCRWAKASSGLKDDLKDLNEITSACPTCGKARRFKCPSCGDIAVLKRVKGNS